MSQTPLVDAHVVGFGTPTPWLHAEAARGIEIQLREEIAESTTENTRLRAALATSKDPCVYCQLPKDEMAKCRSGFPGCARADDLMGCPELGAALEVDRLERELAEAKIGAARYEYIRKLTIIQYGVLMRDCMTFDLKFDEEVDRRRNEK